MAPRCPPSHARAGGGGRAATARRACGPAPAPGKGAAATKGRAASGLGPAPRPRPGASGLKPGSPSPRRRPALAPGCAWRRCQCHRPPAPGLLPPARPGEACPPCLGCAARAAGACAISVMARPRAELRPKRSCRQPGDGPRRVPLAAAFRGSRPCPAPCVHRWALPVRGPGRAGWQCAGPGPPPVSSRPSDTPSAAFGRLQRLLRFPPGAQPNAALCAQPNAAPLRATQHRRLARDPTPPPPAPGLASAWPLPFRPGSGRIPPFLTFFFVFSGVSGKIV